MKDWIGKRPFWFALGITVVMNLVGLVVVVVGRRLLGLPERPVVYAVLLLSTAIPLGLIWWLGWWEDAGFVTTTHNAYALAMPVIDLLFAALIYGTVERGPPLARYYLAAMFLTGLSEEALSRGLLVRVFLPYGKWKAVLIPSVLFAAAHIVQSLGGAMDLRENLAQIANALVFGIMYGAVRLRIKNIWPLVITHMLGNTFFALAGFGPPNPVHSLADIPLLPLLALWGFSLAVAVYLMSKPLAATIDGQPVGIANKPLAVRPGEQPVG